MPKYIIGNWKMNGTRAQALKLASGVLKRMQEATYPLPHVVLCPSYPYLMPVFDILKGTPIDVGAQDCHAEKEGAFTGDVSVPQLVDIGCRYVIIGHSERRQYHHEGRALIRQKIEAALKGGLHPILCLGETTQEHESRQTLSVIAEQLTSHLPENFSPPQLLIAYEPLWAIGTNRTPTGEEIEEVTGFIKHELATRITGGAMVSTLYGGSVNASNAAKFLNLPHVNGLLVGGASLNLDAFWKIVTSSSPPA